MGQNLSSRTVETKLPEQKDMLQAHMERSKNMVIEQIDASTNKVICKYASLESASKNTLVWFRDIQRVINGTISRAGGFRWAQRERMPNEKDLISWFPPTEPRRASLVQKSSAAAPAASTDGKEVKTFAPK